MKKKILTGVFSMLLAGCLHNAPNYPGASGSSIVPADFVNSKCPDFSGTYEAVGRLVSGDDSAKMFEQRMYFHTIFPITAKDEWQKTYNNYRRHEEPGPKKGVFFPPDMAAVVQLSERSVLVSISYKDTPVGSYHSEFPNKAIFVCVDGKLVWGGADNVQGRSEWGSNSGNRSYSVYLENDGSLIYTRNQQVHMNMLFGIPAGTAEYWSVYRFKRLNTE